MTRRSKGDSPRDPRGALQRALPARLEGREWQRRSRSQRREMTMNAVINTQFKDYRVADIGLADLGRREIAIAETEMPGLMSVRDEFGEVAAAQGRAHRRLAAHDDPDRGAHRDAGRARRRGALGLVQHLLDPGPRRRRDRRRRHPGVRVQGRDARGVLGVRAPHLRVAGRQARQHDPRRRRRRDAAADPRRAGREGRRRSSRSPPTRKKSRSTRRSGSASSPSPAGTRRASPRSAA